MINVTQTELPSLAGYISYLKKIWRSHWITNNGEFTRLLEKKLTAYLKVKYLILVSNGTLAIQLALRALNLKGEVITTPYTFAATTTALMWEGLTPVFADIDLQTYNLDPKDVEKKITNKTTAILAVHVYGNPCNVEKLQQIAAKYKLKLIYDAAHAFNVEYNNKSILRFGDVSTLSFHATKTFHTIEGGAIIVKDKTLFDKLKLIRNFGIKSEEEIVVPGINAKMNEFQAAMGLCNLKHISSGNMMRKKLYVEYLKLLGNNKFISFQQINTSKYNYSYMPIVLKSQIMRDRLYKVLISHGIKPRKYFYPLTTDLGFNKNQEYNQRYNIINAKYISDRIICLPMYAGLKLSTVKTICNIINAFLA